MNVHALLAGVFVRYGLAQAVLLPLMLLSWFVLPRHASLRLQWALHRAIVVLTVALPIAFAFPVIPDLHLLPADKPTVAMAPTAAESESVIGEDAMPFSPPPSTFYVPPADPAASTVDTTRPSAGVSLADATTLLPPALAVLSVLGLLAFAFGIIRQVVRERKLIQAAGSVRRIGKVRTVTVATLRSPFSTGLLRPRIYLPLAIACRPLARRMVLAHEAIHVRDGHIAWTFVERLLAAVFWFNPLAHLVAKGGARLRELVCDRGAGKIRGDAAYCRVLLDAASSLVDGPEDPVLANGWIGRRFLSRRIEFLSRGLGTASRRWVYAATSIAALVGLAVLLGCGPRVLPAETDGSGTAPATPPSYTTLTKVEGAWPGGTLSSKVGLYPAYRDAVMNTAANGWNLGTGRMYNLWAGPELKAVLGVNNPEGFWFLVADSEGVDATAFNDDIHAVVAGLLLHLPFLQRIWAGLRATDQKLEGETGFVLSVNADGVVTRAEPDPAKPGNTKLAKAYAASMGGWKLTTRPLASAYRVRVPIASFLRQDPPRDWSILGVRLGDAVAEVRWDMMASVFPETLGGQEMMEAWHQLLPFVQDPSGTVLIAVTVAPDGGIERAWVLDTDLPDASRANAMAQAVQRWPRLEPVPSGRQITAVLLSGYVESMTDTGLRGWEIHRQAFAVSTDAVRYFDFLLGGSAGRVKLELPGSNFISIQGAYPKPSDPAP